MPEAREILTAAAAEPEVCREWIEERIIRAFIQLTLSLDRAEACRTISLGRIGPLEACLTEIPLDVGSHVPPFWVEIYSHASGSVVDSYGCYNFGEGELASAVELIMGARRHQPTLH